MPKCTNCKTKLRASGLCPTCDAIPQSTAQLVEQELAALNLEIEHRANLIDPDPSMIGTLVAGVDVLAEHVAKLKVAMRLGRL